MFLLVVQLIVSGEALALTTIPTPYKTMDTCERVAQAAYVARRDDVSSQLTLKTTCLNAEEFYK